MFAGKYHHEPFRSFAVAARKKKFEAEIELEWVENEYKSFRKVCDALSARIHVNGGHRIETSEPFSFCSGCSLLLSSCEKNDKHKTYLRQVSERVKGMKRSDRVDSRVDRKSSEAVSGRKISVFAMPNPSETPRRSSQKGSSPPRRGRNSENRNRRISSYQRASAPIPAGEVTRGVSKEEKKRQVLIGDDGKVWKAPPTLGDVCDVVFQATGRAFDAVVQECQGILSFFGITPSPMRQESTTR